MPLAVALAATLAALFAAPVAASAALQNGDQDGAREGVPVPALVPVDSLVALGRLQEAAWEARSRGDTALADTLLVRLEAILRTPPISMEPLSMDSQGVSFTYRLDHGHGVSSIFKVSGSDIFCRECGADREVAAYAIDRILGLDLTPMTLAARVVDNHGDTLSGSVMYFVHDAHAPREVGALKPDLLRFFDSLIGNSDRHKSNWLVLADGRTVAIDHNRAFEYHPPTRPKTCWETEIDSIFLPGALGRPFERARSLPADSLAPALEGLDPTLAEEFMAMRGRVVARIEQRMEQPAAEHPLTDCAHQMP